MRIEGISEGSASQLAGHAFEHHVPVRTPLQQRASRPAPNTTTTITDATGSAVIDTHDSAAESPPRHEVEYTRRHRVIAVGSEQKGVIDRNDDGMIDLRDLPFDYFQIARQMNRVPVARRPPEPEA